MKAFTPCPSRWLNREGDDIVYGCLRPVEDGHMHRGGPTHSNGGHAWSALRNINSADRCLSLIQGSAGGVSRCVEDAGHYPESLHMRTGYKPKAWSDEMSLNPPPVKPAHDPHRQDRIMDAAENLATIWRGLGPEGRRMVNEHVGRDLYKALHTLAIEVEGRVPLPEGVPDDDGIVNGAPADDAEYPIGAPEMVNGAPGVTGFIPPVESISATFDAQLIRRDALHHARKVWPVIAGTAQEQADQVITIAQAFEKYLTDGASHPAPEGRPLLESDGPDRRYTQADTIVDSLSEGAFRVIEAAQRWVDEAHLNNRSGLENWRNWADDHDVILINAVLTMRGMPPIESEKP